LLVALTLTLSLSSKSDLIKFDGMQSEFDETIDQQQTDLTISVIKTEGINKINLT
jgi:hypothetical protein